MKNILWQILCFFGSVLTFGFVAFHHGETQAAPAKETPAAQAARPVRAVSPLRAKRIASLRRIVATLFPGSKRLHAIKAASFGNHYVKPPGSPGWETPVSVSEIGRIADAATIFSATIFPATMISIEKSPTAMFPGANFVAANFAMNSVLSEPNAASLAASRPCPNTTVGSITKIRAENHFHRERLHIRPRAAPA